MEKFWAKTECIGNKIFVPFFLFGTVAVALEFGDTILAALRIVLPH